jgi:hypothetical protein
MKSIHAVLAAAVIIVCIVIGYYNGAFTNMGYPPPGAGNQWKYTPVPHIPTTGPITPGTYTMVDHAYNSLSIQTALTLAADVDQSFWAYRSGWVLLGAHGGSGTNVELTTADNGVLYVMMKPVSGQLWYADVAHTVAMNDRAIGAQFSDVDGDNLKEIMVQWNMANIAAAKSGYPQTTFSGFYLGDSSAGAALHVSTGLITYVSTVAAATSKLTSAISTSTTAISTSKTAIATSTTAIGTTSYTNPTLTSSTGASSTYFETTYATSIITGGSSTYTGLSSTITGDSSTLTSAIATTSTTSKYSTATGANYSIAAEISFWPVYMTLGTVQTGAAIYKVEVKCDSIQSSKATFSSINIPGKGVVPAASFTQSLTDTYQIWSYTLGNDLSNALYWQYPPNTYDKQDLTTGVQTTLISGDSITWTVSIYMLNAAQTTVIATGTFITSMA